MQILSNYPDTCLLLRVLGGLLSPTRPGGFSYELGWVESLQAILGLHPGQLVHVLRGFHSVLDIQVSQVYHTLGITPFHASFPQFLFEQTRAGKYYIDTQNINADLVRGAADLMRDYDKRKSSLE